MFSWQPDLKNRSRRSSGIPDQSAMRLYDSLTNSKSQASSVFLRRKEWIENLPHLILRNSWSRILDPDQNRAFLKAGTNPDLPVPSDSLDRIDNEIGQNLAKLIVIQRYGWYLGIKIIHNLYI